MFEAGVFTRTAEPACAAVQLCGGLGEQLEDGRVGPGAGHQAGGGRHQPHVARGDVLGEVHHALWHHHGREVGKAARIGLALREVEQADARRLQQHLYHQGLGRRGKHHGVDVSVQKGDSGRGLFQLTQSQLLWIHTVDIEQGGEQAGHAAARCAHVDAPAFELGQIVNGGRSLVEALGRCLTVKEPQRLHKQAAQGGDGLFIVVTYVGAATLHKTQVGFAGTDQFQVGRRAFGGQQLDRDAVAGQCAGVMFAEFVVGTLGGPGGQHHALGRVGVEPPVGECEQGQRQQGKGSNGHQQITQ